MLLFGVAAILGALNRKLGYAGMLVVSVIFGLVQCTPASYLSYFSEELSSSVSYCEEQASFRKVMSQAEYYDHDKNE